MCCFSICHRRVGHCCSREASVQNHICRLLLKTGGSARDDPTRQRVLLVSTPLFSQPAAVRIAVAAKAGELVADKFHPV